MTTLICPECRARLVPGVPFCRCDALWQFLKQTRPTRKGRQP